MFYAFLINFVLSCQDTEVNDDDPVPISTGANISSAPLPLHLHSAVCSSFRRSVYHCELRDHLHPDVWVSIFALFLDVSWIVYYSS